MHTGVRLLAISRAAKATALAAVLAGTTAVLAGCSESEPTAPAATEVGAVVASGNVQVAKGGPSTISRTHVVVESYTSVNGLTTGKASCPAGEIAVGGGVRLLAGHALQKVVSSHPEIVGPPDGSNTPVGWSAELYGTGGWPIFVYAICVPTP
jgi:hypothetical protein